VAISEENQHDHEQPSEHDYHDADSRPYGVTYEGEEPYPGIRDVIQHRWSTRVMPALRASRQYSGLGILKGLRMACLLVLAALFASFALTGFFNFLKGSPPEVSNPVNYGNALVNYGDPGGSDPVTSDTSPSSTDWLCRQVGYTCKDGVLVPNGSVIDGTTPDQVVTPPSDTVNYEVVFVCTYSEHTSPTMQPDGYTIYTDVQSITFPRTVVNSNTDIYDGETLRIGFDQNGLVTSVSSTPQVVGGNCSSLKGGYDPTLGGK
jgi:hypothetical protein